MDLVATFLNGKRVLVADDDAEVSELLKNILNAVGASVLAASTGPEALRLALESPPDLVCLDVMMPGMDGCGVLINLRGDERTARVPVLMMSARSEPTLPGIVTGLGASALLAKPFRIDEFIEKARQAMTGGGSAQ
ncbi:MAG: response regulator [Planctomycetes bacterium]|nr:response regulator [Planctomycetota bacterium]